MSRPLIQICAFFLALFLGVSASAEAPPKPPGFISLDDNPVITGDWQLPEGHWIRAKMPMHLVYPRPDSETATWARHRWAYPGITYRIPVAVQGGAYPFRFEVLRGPPGMTIGETAWDANYGIVSWVPPDEGGSFPVSIRVTDQEGSQVTAEFNVTVGRDRFVFLDPAASPGGDGTAGSPLKTFEEIHKNSADDRTFSGKILYLRGGRHTLTGPEDSNGNFRIDGDNKPLVWLGYPGEQVDVDASAAVVNFISGSGTGDDFFAQGFRTVNSRPDIANSRFFFFAGDTGERATFFEMGFQNLVRGTMGNDNPGAIVRFKGGRNTSYFVVKDCSIHTYTAPLVGSIYATQYAVIEGNTLGLGGGGSIGQGIFAKGRNDFWSVRKNKSVEQQFSQGAIENFMGDAREATPSRIEIAYNLVVIPNLSDNMQAALVYNWSNSASGSNNYTWVYRNTVIGRLRGLNGGEYTVVHENNIFLNNQDPPLREHDGATTITVEKRDNLIRSASQVAEVFDAGFRLKNQYRSDYLGKRGHEISH